MKCTTSIAAAMIAYSLCSTCDGGGAVKELQIDINSVTMVPLDTSIPITEDYTGILEFYSDQTTILAGILIDGVSNLSGASLDFVRGRLVIDDGETVGGNAVLLMRSGGSLLAHTAMFTGGGEFGFQPGLFDITADFNTSNNTLSQAQFDGIDLTPWLQCTFPTGSGRVFKYLPSAILPDKKKGTPLEILPDTDVDIDLFLVTNSAVATADLNMDGVVGSADLGILLAAWGPLP